MKIAREAISEMHDKFVEGIVYQGNPIISSTVSTHPLFIIQIERERKCTNREPQALGAQE